MILKKRTTPRSILKHQALFPRLPPAHPKISIIQENLSKMLSGYKGEKSIDYPLSFLSEKEYYILHDLRIKDSNHYFQIDSLLMTERFFIILEVKNIAGTLYFDQMFHQLIRTIDGKETAFGDPITQSNRHVMQFKKWLAKNRLSEIPLLSLVVISSSNTLIRSSPGAREISQKVIHSSYLPTKMQEIERKYPIKILSEKEIKKVGRLLKRSHSPTNQSILEQYSIHSNELLKGVFCPICRHLPMVRVYGKWFCSKCQYTEKDTHLNALNDYVLLLGPEITNQKLREFLNINSPALATRLLLSMGIPNVGTTKDRIYYLPFMKE